MSPLVQPPARGYADWQRVSNYDTGSLFTAQEINNAVTITSPVLDVSRYAYFGLYVSLAAGQCAGGIIWYLDEGTTEQAGFREIVWSTLMRNAFQGRILNLGPFCTFAATPFGGNYSCFVNSWGTNRQYPLEVTPSHPVLVDDQNVGIGANTQITDYPADYYSGPVEVSVALSQAGGAIEFDYLNGIGNWDVFSATGLATNTTQQFTFTTPPGAWRVRVVNTAGAAGVYTLVIIPSMTGAT